MELFTLLGKLIACNEWTDSAQANTFVQWNGDYIELATVNIEDIDELAKSVLDIYDPVECQNYGEITFVFDSDNNYEMTEIIFGKEHHRVKEEIDSMIHSTYLRDIYTRMCYYVLFPDLCD